MSHFSPTKKIEKESGLGPPIGDPDPESTGDSEWRSLVNSRSRPPIDDPDPFTGVASAHKGRRRPQWRGRGLQLAASTTLSFQFSLLD
ncbi:hypothetical protein CRG98_005238 [Punica granatum]|uniref:Uncharacterized protein n=1 Tax=Punica granatum TaxID=22663 RepID=A0A2I0L0V9_PUNGR|nr:hypothetical protein CRG98_005238 [Punica granatum]